MINKPPPFKGLNIRIPIQSPIKGEGGFIHQGSGLPTKLEDLYWVAVKELKFSYYIGETRLFTIYTHYGNLILIP